MPRNTNCQRCPLHENVKSVCVWGTGNQNADIMLLGEGPGAEEDATGLPFVGSAGKVLDQALIRAGLSRQDVYTSNIVRCRPPGNRAPTITEAKACFSYLAEEIEAVKPKVVVALGGTAVKILSGKDSITRLRGTILEPAKHVRLNGAKLIGTYHPAAYLHSRNPMMLQGLVDDLTLAAKLAKGRSNDEGQVSHIQTLLTPGYTAEALRDELAKLASAKALAMDCEWTYATDRRIAWPWTKGAQLFSISLSGRIGADVYSVAFACPLTEEFREVLANFIRGKKVIFHNGIADLIWLHHLHLPITLAGDTMLLAHLFNETQPLSLASLASVNLGVENWKQPLWKDPPITDEGWEQLLDYNSVDTYVTLLLMEKLESDLRKLDEDEQVSIRRHYKNFMLPATIMFVRMALRGMPLSEEAVAEAIVREIDKMQGYVNELAQATERKPEYALAMAQSPAQVKELLRSSYGIEVDTTDAYIMEELAEKYPICELIQSVKHQGKLLGTYLQPWLQMLQEQGDGRLHSVYSITRTATGRTSAQTEKGASIQLVPRESWMRRLFIAPDGFEIDSPDYAQLEMRIAAIVAPERGLLQRFEQGIDPHLYTGASIAGLSVDELAHRIALKDPAAIKLRQDAKPLNFGLLYGMQAQKLVTQAKKDYKVVFTLEEAEEFRNKWFKTHSDFQSWYKRGEKKFYQGYVKTLFGRYRRNLPDANKVCNTEVQTPATELCMLALIELDNYFVSHPELETELVGFVHDSGLILRPAHRKDEIAEIIRRIMSHPPTHKLGVDDLGVPLEVDIKSGKSWY